MRSRSHAGSENLRFIAARGRAKIETRCDTAERGDWGCIFVNAKNMRRLCVDAPSIEGLKARNLVLAFRELADS